MAYTNEKNKGIGAYTIKTSGLSTIETSGINQESLFYELEPAEVLDIILDENHPDFIKYSDIGKVKLRYIISENGRDSNMLGFAMPLDSNIKSFPLIGEIVIGVIYLNNLYYTQRLNVYNDINQNSVPGISLFSLKKEKSGGDGNVDEYNDIESSGSPNKQNNKDKFKLGNVFKINTNIKQTKPFEGDIIFEGRFGQSISFSSNQNDGSPNLKIRVGQPNEVPDNLLATIDNNINNDPNSIWMTTTEIVPFTPSTQESDIHLQFYDDKSNKFFGNQIFINSDRIIINSKKNEIMGFAKKAINLVTDGIFTIDAVNDIYINTTLRTIINSPQIYLGNKEATEPVVLGEKLKLLMESLIDILLSHTHPTGTGPSGPPMPPAPVDLNKLKRQIETTLSKQNFSL